MQMDANCPLNKRINNGLINLPELPLNVTLEFRENIEKIKELINYR